MRSLFRAKVIVRKENLNSKTRKNEHYILTICRTCNLIEENGIFHDRGKRSMKLIIKVKLKIEQHRIATVRDNFLLRANLLMSPVSLFTSLSLISLDSRIFDVRLFTFHAQFRDIFALRKRRIFSRRQKVE